MCSVGMKRAEDGFKPAFPLQRTDGSRSREGVEAGVVFFGIIESVGVDSCGLDVSTFQRS